MKKHLIVLLGSTTLFLGLISPANVYAQKYGMKFRIWEENSSICACTRAAKFYSVAPNGQEVTYTGVRTVGSSNFDVTYEIRLDVDPRSLIWKFANTIPPCPPGVRGNCNFSEAANIPIYRGSDPCATMPRLYYTGFGSSVLYILSEYSLAELTLPTLLVGGGLSNLCDESVAIKTTNGINEQLIWQVSRTSDKDGVWKDLTTTSGVNSEKTTISRTALADLYNLTSVNGEQFFIRVKLANPDDCWIDRTSPSTLVVFQSGAPASIVTSIKPPSCIGGDDGSIKVTGLKNANGSTYIPTGNLRYSIEGNGSSATVDSLYPTFNKTTLAAYLFGITSGTWIIKVEGPGNFCPSAAIENIVPSAVALVSPTLSVSQPVYCTGGTGSIRANMSGAVPSQGFTYTLSQGTVQVAQATGIKLNNYTFNNLPPGSYSVSVIVSGCTFGGSTSNITLHPATNLVALQLTSQNISCAGQINGGITATRSAGLSPYQISIDGGGFVEMPASSFTYTGLTQGNHQVVVRDVNGCTASENVNIGVNPNIGGKVGALDITAVTCAGFNNGIVNINATGALGVVYEYSLNGSAYQPMNQFFNLGAGTFPVSIRDQRAPACRWDSTIVVTEPAPIVINDFSITNAITCYGYNDGELSVLASGGNPQPRYTYSLEDAVTGLPLESNSTSLTANFTGLAAGDYRVLVTDGQAGCFATANLSLTQPAKVSLIPTLSNYNGSNVSCANSADGTIELSSLGGAYPHVISISGRPNQVLNNNTESVSFINFSAGDYFVTLSSNAGACEEDTLIHILAPQPLTLSLTEKIYGDNYNVSCHGLSDGLITAEALGGTLPYTFTAGTQSHVSVMTPIVDFINLPANAYTVVVTDINNCTLQAETILTEPATLEVSEITIPDIYGRQLTCNGDQNARATVFTQGGSYPQTITLQSTMQQGITNVSAEGVVFLNLGAGNYSVEIVDEEGCTTTGTFDVVEPDAVTLDNSQTVIQRPDCAGQQTGSVELKANGGIAIGTTGNGTSVVDGTDYSYQLTFLGDRSRLPFPYPEQQTRLGAGINFDQLIAGSYQVLITDQVGCTSIESIVITTNNQVSANLSTTDITCKSDQDGSATVAITGGASPYEVVWRYQDMLIDTDAGVNENQLTTITNLQEGLYAFEITDANGCAFYTGNFNFQIEGPTDPLVLQSTIINVTCNGNDNGLIMLNASGGWQESNYRFGTDVNNLTVNNTMHEDLPPGTYRYFAQDNRGCIDTLDVTIIEPEVLESSILNVTNVSCYGLSDGAFELRIEGGIVPYQLSVDNGMTWIEGSSLQLLNANTYATQIRDANNCLIHQNVIITEPFILTANVIGQENTLCKQATGSATASVTGGSSPYNFSWTNSESQIIETSLTATNLFAGNYVFQVKDDHACQYDLPVTIINTNDIVFDVINIQGVKCFGESNGRAELNITTIQSPYTVLWDNGSTTNATLSLPAGNRSVILEDANQCQVEKMFVVPSPQPISINITEEIAPTCFGVCNGILDFSATGGTGAYTYTWSNGATSNRLTNICAGQYIVTIADVNNCVLEETINFQGPSQNKLGIEDTTYYICQGQKVNIKLKNWTNLVWSSTNGFRSASDSVVISQAGTYSVSASDGAGCISQANFKVVYSKDLLKAEFLVPRETYVGDTVVCVNISVPHPDLLVWDFDRINVKNVGSKAGYQQLVFLKEGEYEITLFSHLGGCVDRQTKTILVLQNNGIDDPDLKLGYEETGIKEVTVFPNPNDGRFTCDVRLHKVEDVHIKVLNLNGNVLAEHSDSKTDHLQTELDIDKQPSGLYWLVVEVEGDMKIVKVLVR